MKKFLILFLATIICSPLFSQEIAQWRGANRDGIYEETALLKIWPENGPEMLWHFDQLGEGHASAAVTSEKVFTAGLIDGTGYVFAFDHNGKLLWKSEYGKEWDESWPGVRSTPLIYDTNLYIMSGFGKVVCMNTNDGAISWSVDLMNDYGGQNIKWGVTENLLIDDNKLFCTPGGEDTNVIALDKSSGELLWKSKGNGEATAYCSPGIIKLPERNIFVTMTANSIIGIDAKTGEFLWRHEQTNQWSVHANTPLFHDGYLYCVSGYGKGSVMLKIMDNGGSVSEVWRNSDLDNRMGGVILLNGRIYGSGNQNKKWFCLDWKTGDELFVSEKRANGNIIYADDMLYCYTEDGEVGLLDPQSDDFNFVSSFEVPYGEKWHWAHLVIYNKRLYVRHGTSLMVYSISSQ